jgi:hypothetical protein
MGPLPSGQVFAWFAGDDARLPLATIADFSNPSRPNQ